MLGRLTVTNTDATVAVTELFWRRCLEPRGFVVVESPKATRVTERTTGYRIAELLNRIKANWKTSHSDQILWELENTAQQAGVENNKRLPSEISLLRALALERSLGADDQERANLYEQCLGGQFEAILVTNNLAVLKTRMGECRQALAMFRDAMFQANAFPENLVRAPFYNFAIVVEHLYRNRFVFQPQYLQILDEVTEWVPCLASLKKDPNAESRQLTDPEIARIYRSIAKFGREITQKGRGFFCDKFSYVANSIDISEEFGDMSDNADREAAHRAYSEAMRLAKDQRFGESINFFLMAGNFARDYVVDATVQIEHVTDTWRRKQNADVLSLAESEEYEQAVEKLRFPPSERLKQELDGALIEEIQEQKYARLLSTAEALVRTGEIPEAITKYKQLLREPLDKDLRQHVSICLAALLR